ncbi:uncharacterized protein F5891DRAFT_48143 [Suillus fuscotomentosus]|uniref:Uncharacterized protein n=1 Tax=Suillus fuscotomentosus TaxID=1912939 RepID=A0AAD4HE84_9AGAM|nr:uncharacterized protein F5891DRAFT_48143 [Suillus fuscotomentosus]KAG1893292.1 hypothetical protein F5891DRAFT_48143 [Suillus fuscotomentosus]
MALKRDGHPFELSLVCHNFPDQDASILSSIRYPTSIRGRRDRPDNVIVSQQGLSYLFPRVQIPHPKTLVGRASDEETGTDDESYFVHTRLMALECQFNRLCGRFCGYFVGGDRHSILFHISVSRHIEGVAMTYMRYALLYIDTWCPAYGPSSALLPEVFFSRRRGRFYCILIQFPGHIRVSRHGISSLIHLVLKSDNMHATNQSLDTGWLW